MVQIVFILNTNFSPEFVDSVHISKETISDTTDGEVYW